MLDIDKPYSQLKKILTEIEDYITELLNMEPNLELVSFKERKSFGGRIHLLLEFNRELSVLENLKFRAYLGDDDKRIVADLWRLENLGGESKRAVDRIFVARYRKRKLETAGEWRLVRW